MDFSTWPEIIKGFFTGAMKDMKTIPHTALSAVFLWMTMWIAGFVGWFIVWPPIAEAVDLAQKTMPQVQSLDASIKELKASLLVERWERQIKEMEDQIFTLQLDIDAQRKRRLEVPVPMLAQLNKLTQAKIDLQKKLERYTAANMSLLEPFQ